MRQIGMISIIGFIVVSILLGCEMQEKHIAFSRIDVSDIDKIEHTGTTGGKDGDYLYYFSDSEIGGFIDLLNQVELGDEVDKSIALSSGAVSYYTIYFSDGTTLTVSPGQYFKIEDIYYECRNYAVLYDKKEWQIILKNICRFTA